MHQFDPSELETDSRMNDVEDVSANWKDSVVVNPKLIEYGEKIAEITDYAILDDKGLITNTLMKGSTFSVRMKVDFHEEIKEPIYAFTIKNLQGLRLPERTPCMKRQMSKVKRGRESGDHLHAETGSAGRRISDFSWMYRLPQRRVCGISQIV